MNGVESIPNMARQVSVVLICYNYGRYLDRALESVFSQTVPTGEVLVIDDGSTDNTHDIVLKYEDRVRYVNHGHHGVCFARNLGLQKATGRWIVFLDADDALDPLYVEKTLQVWRDQPTNLAFIYTQRRDMDQPHLISSFPEFSEAELKKKNYIVVSALMDLGRARVIGYDPAFQDGLEDYDFFLTMVKKGGVGRLLNEPLLYVRSHPETRSLRCGVPSVRWTLLGLLLQKHATYFSAEERRCFLQRRRDYLIRAVEIRRRTRLSVGQRLQDLLYLIRSKSSLNQLFVQLFYAVSPPIYRWMIKVKSKARIVKSK